MVCDFGHLLSVQRSHIPWSLVKVQIGCQLILRNITIGNLNYIRNVMESENMDMKGQTDFSTPDVLKIRQLL